MAVIGIDLGTTNSLVCVYRNGRAELIPNKLGSLLTSPDTALRTALFRYNFQHIHGIFALTGIDYIEF